MKFVKMLTDENYLEKRGILSIKLYIEPGRPAHCEVYSRSAGMVESRAATPYQAVKMAIERSAGGRMNEYNRRRTFYTKKEHTGG